MRISDLRAGIVIYGNPTCVASYPNGTVVSVTINANPGSFISSIGEGYDSPPAPPDGLEVAIVLWELRGQPPLASLSGTITMNQSKSVSVTFTSSTATVTTFCSPPVGGTVTGAGAYPTTTVVNVQISAASGWYINNILHDGPPDAITGTGLEQRVWLSPQEQFQKTLQIDYALNPNFDPTTITSYLAQLYLVGDSTETVIFGTLSPTVTQAPASQTANVGNQVTFSVAVTGRQPLTYQWLFNGQSIAGATTASLTLNSVVVANSGGYSVTVGNAFGYATSASAYLGVLAVDTTQPCYLMTVTPLPAKQSGMNNLAVVTHGWIPRWDNPSEAAWITGTANAIQANVPSDWQVEPYWWGDKANVFLADKSFDNAKNIGTQIGRQIVEQGWQRVHLIGHSSGAALIQSAADAIRSGAPSTVIQTTFLDPYFRSDYSGLSWFGRNADWSDGYDAYNFWTDQLGSVILKPDLTYGVLANAYNVDVTWVDPNKKLTPILCPSSTADSTPNFCGTSATSSHGWPIDFYSNSVVNTLSSCAVGFGFPLSDEGGGWNNRANYPVGLSPVVLCGQTAAAQNKLPLNSGPQLQISVLPYGTSGTGVNLLGAGGFSLNTTSSQQSPQANAKIGGAAPMDSSSTNATGTPSWLAVGVTITNPINFVQFDSSFTDTNAALGLLTVYWNTNQIGTVDESVVPPGVQTYRFFLPVNVTSGLYVLGFRLDSFSNTTSSIMVTNVTTGFVGVTQPTTLGISQGAGGVPILQLTGASNFTYSVQSSTDLVNWVPMGVVANTNCTVFFGDPDWTNYSARFYRVLLP